MPYNFDNSEEKLLKGCIENDRGAQKALYEKYKRAMYSRAFRILADEYLAHDILQESFIMIFRDIGNFRGRSTLGAWIKTIVVRQAIAKLKEESRFESLEEQHDSVVEWTDSLTGEALDNAIRKLPTGYRLVFNLVEVEGYTHKEVADMLHISVGTSKSQLHYSKKVLQKYLSELRS